MAARQGIRQALGYGYQLRRYSSLEVLIANGAASTAIPDAHQTNVEPTRLAWTLNVGIPSDVWLECGKFVNAKLPCGGGRRLLWFVNATEQNFKCRGQCRRKHAEREELALLNKRYQSPKDLGNGSANGRITS